MSRSIDEPIVLPRGQVSEEFLLSIGYRPAARSHKLPAGYEFKPQPMMPPRGLILPPNHPIAMTTTQRPLELPKQSQFILAIDSQFFLDRGFANGIHAYDLAKLYQEVDPYLVIRQRAALEKDTRYRQILPYKVLTQVGTDGVKRIIGYRRLQKGGESRLYGLMSIGFGGHVDLEDIETFAGSEQACSTVDLETTIRESSRRELGQEVHYLTMSAGQTPFEPANGEIKPANMFIHYSLKDKLGESWRIEDDVHSVHVAFVYFIEVPPGLQLVSGEPEQIEMLEPMTAEALLASDMPKEEWTRLLLEFMCHPRAFQLA